MILGYYATAPVIVLAANVYPCYQTYKALVANKPEVTTRWLQYWMVFALFTMVESIVDMVGAFLPFFYEAKLLFMLWLSLDKFQGATYLYKRFIEPALDQHHGSIDEQLNFVVDRAANFKIEDARTFVDWASDKATKLANANAPAAVEKVAASPAKKAPKAKEEEPKSKDETQADVPEEVDLPDISDETHATEVEKKEN